MTAPRARLARGGGATSTREFAVVAVLAFGAIVAALVSQHAFSMQP